MDPESAVREWEYRGEGDTMGARGDIPVVGGRGGGGPEAFLRKESMPAFT